MHLKFEEFYTDEKVKIDLIAERILTLQAKPYTLLKNYLNISTVNVGKDISNDVVAFELVISSL